MDKLRDFIQQNKEEFDVHQAPDHLWDKIEDRLEPKSRFSNTNWLRIAAIILLTVGSTLLFQHFYQTNSTPKLSSFDKELNDIQGYYGQLISQRINTLYQDNLIDEMDKQEIETVMKELDEDYESLKVEMYNDIDNEKVLQEVIEHFRKRVEILELMITRIQRNNDKTENNESIHL